MIIVPVNLDTMQHAMVTPITYTNEWKHLFVVKCTCQWESDILADSTRKVKFREPYEVSEREFSQHVKCERRERLSHVEVPRKIITKRSWAMGREL